MRGVLTINRSAVDRFELSPARVSRWGSSASSCGAGPHVVVGGDWNQVEQVLARLPGVIEVAVYPVDDALLGEALATSLTVAANTRLTVADVKLHCRRYLPDHMVPKYVDICAAVPATLIGKVSWRTLADIHGDVAEAA
jgi:non-ribosomal peptide synthetase component E (peptide arylation enzyme)